ncbi:MAG TPA: cytidylate kinase-like family protein [Sedimentisphaerales bacterium]|nr:cytidylate kinase-like family protein [Sedimentisphaerales bacterium]
MNHTEPLVITISRQLGSGGAYIGRKLAEKLNIFYADREIISMAAKELSVLDEDLETRDEKIISFWESFLEFSAFAHDAVYMPPQQVTFPTDLELFRVESVIIERIAKERSAVIIGRCASHILREYKNHKSIFLHGDVDFRKGRIQKLYDVSAEEAGRMIAHGDKERADYRYKFIGKDWTDTRQYSLSIDTSKIGVDKSVELILDYLKLF